MAVSSPAPMHSDADQPCPSKLRASPAPWPAEDGDDSDEPMEDADIVFPFFAQFPPEIRHQIYLAALPNPGINFFNIHTFPNDHPGANRSTSPPSLHIDLRRLDIDDDDETVAQYDPSAWQARDALRRTCREARYICAIPADRLVTLTLTMPKRGLFVRAGDGLLRSMTPLEDPDIFRADDIAGPTAEREPIIRRTIQLDADEMVSLSIENCSFNLPFEESPLLQGSDDEDVDDMGWSFDPEFAGGVPLGLAADKFCLNLARGNFTTLRALREVAPALWKAATGHWATDFDNIKDLGGVYRQGKERRSRQAESFLMLDSQTTAIAPERRRSALKQRRRRPDRENSTENDSPTTTNVVYWDRWGDAYISRAWDDDAFFTTQQLVKTLPEQTDMRARYLASAILQSPKRPRGYPE